MNPTNLLDIILYLVPTAKCSIWSQNPQMVGDEPMFTRSGCLIIWGAANTVACPTQIAINNVDVQAVLAARITRKKAQRDASLQEDFAFKVGYKIAKDANPSLTVSQYLDTILPVD